MKKNYEIYLKQHVKGSVWDNYETVHFDSYQNNYWEYLRKAKEYSMHIGEERVGHYKFSESKNLDKGLAAVCLVCYYKTEDCSYNVLFREYFENGKGEGRMYEEQL